jgi:leader peptidase (prepilin peptidase)/N-methyltransferase
MMKFFLFFLVFFLGASFGSFFNVLSERLPRKESIWGRSFCRGCKKKLSAKELIPLFSYIFLKGKCSKCKARIPFLYFLNEFLFGILFLNFFFIKDILSILFVLGAFFFFYYIFLVDLRFLEVPDIIFLLSFLFGFFYSFFEKNLSSALFWGVLFSSPFFLVALISREKLMGLGDPIFIFILSFYFEPPKYFLLIPLSFLFGGGLSLFLVLLKKKTFKSKVPLASFLSFLGIIFLGFS